MIDQKEFSDIEIDVANACEEFLSKVPDQHQSEAKQALHMAWKLGNNDKGFIAADSVVETNRQLLLDRSIVGIQKYGTTLQNANLSEEAILQHALEEALDLANYLQSRLMVIRGTKTNTPIIWPQFNMSSNISLKCSVCHEPQFDSPGGPVCKNGHGGVEGY